MKQEWKFTITIPNLYARYLTKKRFLRAFDKWHRDAIMIEEKCSASPDDAFKWTHLMWKEIHNFIMKGDQVTVAAFDILCKDRGFDQPMSDYLNSMLIYVGIGDQLIFR